MVHSKRISMVLHYGGRHSASVWALDDLSLSFRDSIYYSRMRQDDRQENTASQWRFTEVSRIHRLLKAG